jgi:hypothetical protein
MILYSEALLLGSFLKERSSICRAYEQAQKES